MIPRLDADTKHRILALQNRAARDPLDVSTLGNAAGERQLDIVLDRYLRAHTIVLYGTVSYSLTYIIETGHANGPLRRMILCCVDTAILNLAACYPVVMTALGFSANCLLCDCRYVLRSLGNGYSAVHVSQPYFSLAAVDSLWSKCDLVAIEPQTDDSIITLMEQEFRAIPPRDSIGEQA